MIADPATFPQITNLAMLIGQLFLVLEVNFSHTFRIQPGPSFSKHHKLSKLVKRSTQVFYNFITKYTDIFC